MTLTSDNTLRLFNLDLEQEKAEETIRLSEGIYFFSRQITMFNSRFKSLTIFFQGSVAPALFGKSALTVKGSLGETAVGFDFAPPTISTSVSAGEEPSTNPTIYPVFILWGDGRIFFVATTIGKVIHPKCCKDRPYLLLATMNCGCRKRLNHGSWVISFTFQGFGLRYILDWIENLG